MDESHFKLFRERQETPSQRGDTFRLLWSTVGPATDPIFTSLQSFYEPRLPGVLPPVSTHREGFRGDDRTAPVCVRREGSTFTKHLHCRPCLLSLGGRNRPRSGECRSGGGTRIARLLLGLRVLYCPLPVPVCRSFVVSDRSLGRGTWGRPDDTGGLVLFVQDTHIHTHVRVGHLLYPPGPYLATRFVRTKRNSCDLGD